MCIRSTLILLVEKALADFRGYRRFPPALASAAALVIALSGTALSPQETIEVRIDGLREAAFAWHIPPPVEVIRGARLLSDAPRPAARGAAFVRSIVRSNPRLSPIDALCLATYAEFRAADAGIDPDFFVAALLQESAFQPFVVSSAGALGIAQFTYETAERYGVDPLEPQSAIGGSARLYAAYVLAYAGVYRDPYAAALAAYDAGPGTVAYYHGIPPYPETVDYIADVYSRWARIERDRSPRPSPHFKRR